MAALPLFLLVHNTFLFLVRCLMATLTFTLIFTNFVQIYTPRHLSSASAFANLLVTV